MKSKPSLVLVLTTVADEPQAQALAKALVAERLAACVNRVAVASTYRWQGAIENGSEVLLVIKSTSEHVDRLRARINELSSYDVPEFVVLEPQSVAESYLTWALDACAIPGKES